MPSWFTIAKNEYLLITSGIRKFRKIVLPLLVIAPVIVFLVVMRVANSIFVYNTSMEMFRYFLGFPSVVTPSFYPQIDVTLIVGQFISLLSFFFPIIGGLANVLREVGSVNMDIFWSSPVQPRHIFFGRLAVNLIPIPIFLSVFSVSLMSVIMEYGYSGPLFPISVALIIVLLYITGLWIGSLLSLYLKLRSLSSPKYKDLARAVIVISTVVIVLAFFILSSSQTTVLYTWFSPTNWTSNIIYYAATGTNITLIKYPRFFLYPVFLEPDPLTCLALLVMFFGVVFLLGVFLVRRIKQIDVIGEGIVTIKREERMYRFLRRIIPTKLSRLAVVQLKEFFRDSESLARVLTVFLFPIILYFFSVTRLGSSFLGTNPLSLFVAPGIAFLFIIMVGTMIGQIEATQMTVKGKLVLMTYRKAPHGIKMLVHSKFAEMLIVGLPLGLISGIVFQIVLGSQSPGIQILIPVMLFMVIISCAIALGVYSARPVLQEESGGHLLNSNIIGFIVSLIGGLMLLFAMFPWIINVILSYPILGGLFQIFPYSSNLIVAIYSQFPIIPKELGVLAAVMIGVAASYLSLHIGILKLIRYE